MNYVSECTEDYYYLMAVLFMSPFLSRERFWYYLTSIYLVCFLKTNLKMFYSEPRPTWVFNDLSNVGCSTSFGFPSGHSSNSANMAFLIILDLFFSSDWSRRKHSELNKMTYISHPITFLAVSLVAISFWLFILYDRVFLGKHTLNQVLLGS